MYNRIISFFTIIITVYISILSPLKAIAYNIHHDSVINNRSYYGGHEEITSNSIYSLDYMSMPSLLNKLDTVGKILIKSTADEDYMSFIGSINEKAGNSRVLMHFYGS